MKKVTFYYVRHGQTLFNILGRLQGWCDSPLTEKGYEDALRAETALKDVPFTAAAVSFSGRAVTTAQVILRPHQVRYRTYGGLMEFDYGLLDGERIGNIPEEDLKKRRETGSWKDVGGEDSEDLSRRIRETFARIYEESTDGEKVLVVSHGTYALFLMQDLLGIDLEEYRQACGNTEEKLFPNAGIMVFECTDGDWHIVAYPVIPERFRATNE